METFRIVGRYRFHKDEIFDLIQKKLNYSEERIKEIAALTKVSENQVRKDIFGEELFEELQKSKSFMKLKRDIARNLKIKNVK